jgi:hypothetical protein
VVIFLSALAVVIAAVLLIASFVVGGGFTLVWASVGFAIASMVLLWAARWIGSSPTTHPTEEPAPLPPSSSVASSSTPVADEVSVSAGIPEPDDSQGDDASVPVFPIAAYDSLWVSQIVPLLGELDRDELAMVEARERGGRHRAGVLDAIAEQRAFHRPGARPTAVSDDEQWSAPSSGATVASTLPSPPAPPAPVEPEPSPEPPAEPPVADPVDVDLPAAPDGEGPGSPLLEDERWDWDAVPRPSAADAVPTPEPVPTAAEPEPAVEPEAPPAEAAAPAPAEPPTLVPSTIDLAAVDLDAPPDPGPGDRPVPADDGSGPVLVRTFLGRRSAPITVRRG